MYNLQNLHELYFYFIGCKSSYYKPMITSNIRTKLTLLTENTLCNPLPYHLSIAFIPNCHTIKYYYNKLLYCVLFYLKILYFLKYYYKN